MSNAHVEAIRVLAAAFTTQFTAERVAAYMLAVEDLPVGDVQAVVVELARSGGRFMPTAPEVRRAVLRLRQPEADAGEAWSEVVHWIAKVGRYGEPELSDLTRRAVRAVGGWQTLCDSENPVADRARFLDAFERLAERDTRDTLVAPQLGRMIAAALPGSRYRPGTLAGRAPGGG